MERLNIDVLLRSKLSWLRNEKYQKHHDMLFRERSQTSLEWRWNDNQQEDSEHPIQLTNLKDKSETSMNN